MDHNVERKRNKDNHFMLIHVGRLHYKIECSQPLTAQDLEKAQKYTTTKEWRQRMDLLFEEQGKIEPWSAEWGHQTIAAMDACDYHLELGNENTPLVPVGWHTRFHESSPPSPKAGILLDFENRTVTKLEKDDPRLTIGYQVESKHV